MPTAAAIIIGNEILSGKFSDENGPFFIRRLRELGSDLRRLVTVPDDLHTIVSEVRHCSRAFDVVFTTGGVGPTHDDITLEAIAKALDRPLEVEPSLVALLETYALPINEATMRMAQIPKGTQLIRSGGSYPVMCCENVWIFPGVPSLMRKKFEAVADRFSGAPKLTTRLHVTLRESEIAESLTAIAARHPDVDIGSYPRFEETDFKVILTMESRDAAALEAARAELADAFPLWHLAPERS